ncbi:cell wall-binding repeat-containing protein [Herbiconiux sp. A18JL235]|uniref:Cell wall-binding repeat-containing protein n=1 Tax=Herbiconiux sp. A18JL235 TaxID=3152363 RepID=A0AB39BL49_9MICO
MALATIMAITTTIVVGAPAAAAPGGTSRTIEEAADSIVAPDGAYRQSLSATFDAPMSEGGFGIPVAATTVAWELPVEFTTFGIEKVSISVRGESERISGDPVEVDSTTNTAMKMFGAGELSAITPLFDGEQPYLAFRVYADDWSRPTQPMPPNALFVSQSPDHIDITGRFYLMGDDSGVTPTIALDADRATTFEYSAFRWFEPVDDLWVAPGAPLEVGGLKTQPGDHVSARVFTWGEQPEIDPGVALATEVSAENEVVSVSVPQEFDLAPLLALSGRVWLAVVVEGPRHQSVLYSRIVLGDDAGGGVTTTRISGTDRYAGASAVARASFLRTADTVEVTSGEVFPDALSIAPLAAALHRPLLLVPSAYDSWDPQYRPMVAYVQTFTPRTVEIVGGPRSVSPGWELEFQQEHGQTLTRRIDGADRYEVSRTIAVEAFPGSPSTVFITTGTTFPDALSTVPAAASQHAPILLVDGRGGALDEGTADAVRRMRPTDVVIVGGPVSVSPDIERDLVSRLGAGHVTRIGGPDRYAVAEAVNRAYFSTAPEVFLATGQNFPDALTGGTLAAEHEAPLLLARADCVPGSVLDALADWGTTQVTLLGGPNSLSASVLDLKRCA